MTCEHCREELSAALDGETDDAARAAVAEHLAACPSCARWHQDAARVTRLARTASAETGLDVVPRVIGAAPAPRPRWRRTGPRAALGAVGIVQIGLGLLALLGADPGMSGGEMPVGEMLGAGMAHMSHETGAWNLALGAAFLTGAVWRRHLRGLLPALGAFIAILAIVSAIDLAAGRVEPDRVAAHLVLILGFVLSVVVARTPAPRRPTTSPDRVSA